MFLLKATRHAAPMVSVAKSIQSSPSIISNLTPLFGRGDSGRLGWLERHDSFVDKLVDHG